MLIRFEGENFRSIREPAELSMVAIDEERPGARHVEKLDAALVTTAGIFGPNASGKSNVLAALLWLRRAIDSSLRTWDEVVPVEPFAFGSGRDADSSFVLEMLVDGVRFEYLLDVGREGVSFEALFHYPEGRRRRIFERERTSLVVQRGMGELGRTRALLTDRSLALSIMRRFDVPETSGFVRRVREIDAFTRGGAAEIGPEGVGPAATTRLFADSGVLADDPFADILQERHDEERAQGIALLRMADLGIVDVEVREALRPDGLSAHAGRQIPRLVHAAGDERQSFAMSEESSGTRAWFELIGPLIAALRRGSVVLFDELDASLHPTLTARVLDVFRSRGTNPRGAQLVFTSHHTNLLNHLNRDEVWLTEKGGDGGTRFGALSDFAGERVRRSANIESGYLSGRFGALPDVSDPAVLRALGLIG
jgi:hypothetical protein